MVLKYRFKSLNDKSLESPKKPENGQEYIYGGKPLRFMFKIFEI